MNGRRKAGLKWPTAVIGVLAIIVGVFGCSEIQIPFTLTMTDVRREENGKQAGPRSEAIRKYSYTGLKDQVFVEAPRISPKVARAGDALTQDVVFAVLAPERMTRITVREIVTISGGDIRMELYRKVSDKRQGTHVSTVRFIIPKDLPRRSYELTTTIVANRTENREVGRFRVE